MDVQAMKARVLDFMKSCNMTEGGDGVLAAVSGGADSVCLLFLLKELSFGLGIRLWVFHLNHGLRGREADRDEAFVRALCARLDVPFESAREDTGAFAVENGLSTEEAGRILRYRHLARCAEAHSCQKIATAHHMDDNTETVLMNLFRGSGLRGLGGIRPVRGKIIRPLLCVTREEIEDYLTARRISWCEDATNREMIYTRNRLRNELLPWVKKYMNRRAAEHIQKASEMAAQADEYLRLRAGEILSAERSPGIETGSIPVSVLDRQPDIMKAYLVRALLAETTENEKDITERHIRAVLGLGGPGGGTRADLPGGLSVVRGYETLTITRNEEASVGERMPEPVFRVFSRKKEMEIPKNRYTKWFDYDKIKDMLSVRTRKEGDFFLLPGGGKKTLHRYMIDEKIPRGERDRLLLVAEGSHILWLIGYRISEYYKITDATENILEVTICKGEQHGGEDTCPAQ